MKRKLLLIAVVLMCGLMFTTCDFLLDLFKDKVEEPEVTLESVEFSEISFTGITLLSSIKVKNNVSVDIPFPKIDFDLNILDIDTPLLTGSIPSGGTLKSNESTVVKVSTPFTYANLINLISAMTDDKKENPTYKINLTTYIPVQGFGDFSFQFSHDGNIPQMRVPDITVASRPSASLTYSNILGISTPTGGKIDFSLNVKNNSNIAVLVKDLSYNLKIAGTTFTGGATQKPNLTSKDTGLLTFSFPITAANITSIGLTVLTGGNFNYELTGNYMFGLDFPLVKELGDSFTLRN